MDIKKLAEEYISKEEIKYFKNDVEELLKKDDTNELNERFYKSLEFGTGGLRGIIGGGLNRMNPFIVKRATQGLANYILKKFDKSESAAVIAYDSRNFSDLFALEAARVFAGNGIKTYLFSSLRPTPELSFAVRELNAKTGIVITASHNPSKYNGYKAYWSDGCQVLPPHDISIVEEASKVDEIKTLSREEAIEKGLIVMIDEDMDKKYIDMVKELSIRPELIKEKGKNVKVVYTPLHGTGKMPVARALSEMGIDVIFVDEQKEPDGNFPTVDFPNPEEKSALKLSLELAKKEKADLILATDPDADRLGIAVPDKNGEFILVTGNQLGALLADYIMSSKKSNGTMPENPAFIKTIVTTELQKRIAKNYGATSFDVLTGFKYIGEKIREFEEGKDNYNYLFGGEESYGYLIGTRVRDKDAVSAAVMTAEMALFLRENGKSILDRLNEIYSEHGYFEEILISKYFEGQSGVEVMNNIMKNLRSDPPSKFINTPVKEIKDYLDSSISNPVTGEKSVGAIKLPSSNVLQFVLEDDTIVTARPSGTEPKIKFYASCNSSVESTLESAKKAVAEKLSNLKIEIENLISN